MRVAVIPGDDTGCGTYRMILPANEVMKVRPDWQVELYRPGTVKIGVDKGKLTAVQGLGDPTTIDLLVMQRVGTSGAMQFTDWARKNGIATVIDADDAMWCIDPGNAAHKAWNNKQMHWKTLDLAAERADLVTVTTQYLAQRYGKHGRVEIIDNRIPAEVFSYPSLRHEHDDRVAVGWAGFVGTHPQDLQVVGGAVRDAIAGSAGSVVRVVGDAKGAARVWGLDEVESVGPQPLGSAYFSALTKIDIGLVPLAPSNFNRGKSWLKALEFSAMGVPVIASPTPDNLLFANEVPIKIALTEQQWADEITALIENPEERIRRGEEARRIVAEKFSMDGAGETWAQAWERAYARRQKLAA